ncbi:MAG: phosphohydrolase [Lachnospiraceae bacterium]|nr:phosphohydrolase [Lachnospiraceae bacterium]
METEIINLYNAMISYMSGDPRRIQHFTKVHAYSRLIGLLENMDDHTLFILEAAALMHDIGIREGERLYDRNDGKIQEQLGPGEAEKLLKDLDFAIEDIQRICYLIGHHHTYDPIDGLDYQILVEADFLVNLQEENSSREACENVYKKIFKTESGKKIMCEMYGMDI